jgi:hypothetical protein
VITPQGRVPRHRIDSVFAVHELGTPLPRTAELRRELLAEAIGHADDALDRPVDPALRPLLDRDLIEPWRGATGVLGAVRPDAVVIAGHQQVGALDAVQRAVPDVPLTLLALGSDLASLAFPHYRPLFDQSQHVLAVTATEGDEIARRHPGGGAVHRIGAPMAANTSALSEPNPWVGTTEYVLVITDAESETDDEAVELARLIRLRFPDNPIAISYTDTFVAWHGGRWTTGWPVERSSDLGRLMAWARAVVDLRPGRLFARRCVDALLFGTPIVVPADSRAREHAQQGGGGLWFSTPSELTWCIEALLRPEQREPFSHQGQAYAEEYFGSTQRFTERVVQGTGLATTPTEERGSADGAVPAPV